MLNVYTIDYFLFTFLTSFGTLQLALAKGSRARVSLGLAVLILAYLWFFASRNRNVHSVIEGVQLLSILIIGAVLAVVATKFLSLLSRKK